MQHGDSALPRTYVRPSLVDQANQLREQNGKLIKEVRRQETDLARLTETVEAQIREIAALRTLSEANAELQRLPAECARENEKLHVLKSLPRYHLAQSLGECGDCGLYPVLTLWRNEAERPVCVEHQAARYRAALCDYDEPIEEPQANARG